MILRPVSAGCYCRERNKIRAISKVHRQELYFLKGKLMIFLLILSVILVGCGTSKAKKEEIIEKANQTGIEYFKQNYNIDVVFTEFNVRPEYIESRVGMNGHVQGAEDETIYLLIDYRNYKIVEGFSFEGFNEKYPKNETLDTDPIQNEETKD